MEIMLLLAVFVGGCVVMGIMIGRALFPSPDYSAMARSMREIRDWERKNTPDEPSSLRVFKDTFK
jgi:hypothetical protein